MAVLSSPTATSFPLLVSIKHLYPPQRTHLSTALIATNSSATLLSTLHDSVKVSVLLTGKALNSYNTSAILKMYIAAPENIHQVVRVCEYVINLDIKDKELCVFYSTHIFLIFFTYQIS